MKKITEISTFPEPIKRKYEMIEQLNSIPFPRMEELSSLQYGWYDGLGECFKEKDVLFLKDWIKQLLDYSDFPAPYCFPSPDNAIELEWSFGFWDIICTFEFEKQWVFLHATNLRSKEIREDSFPFEDTLSIEKTARFLENLLKSSNKLNRLDPTSEISGVENEKKN